MYTFMGLYEERSFKHFFFGHSSKSHDFTQKFSPSPSSGLLCMCIPQTALDLLTFKEASFIQLARVPALLIF